MPALIQGQPHNEVNRLFPGDLMDPGPEPDMVPAVHPGYG